MMLSNTKKIKTKVEKTICEFHKHNPACVNFPGCTCSTSYIGESVEVIDTRTGQDKSSELEKCRAEFDKCVESIVGEISRQSIEKIASGEEWAWQSWKKCWFRKNK